MDDTKQTLAEKLFDFSQTYPGGVCVGSLVLAGSFFNYMNFNSYPLFTPEVGLALLVFIALSAFAALFYRFMGSLVRLVFVVLLSFLAIDLNFDSQYAFLAAIVPVLIFRDYTLPILGVVSATVLLSSTVQLAATGDRQIGQVIKAADRNAELSQNAGSDSPALLHIVLDAHIGPQGLVRSSEEAQTADEMRRFFQENGFRLFGGAYTVHRQTINSIPAVLNNNKGFELYGSVKGRSVEANRYFDILQERGYRLSVYETDWLKFCAAREVYACRQWPIADPKPLLETGLPSSDRATVLVSQFFNLSTILLSMSVAYDKFAARAHEHGIRLPALQLQQKSWTSTLVAAHTFDAMIADLARAEPGDAFFAHILLPHEPFAFEADCGLKSPWDWLDESGEFAELAQRQSAYAEQLYCTFGKLRRAFDALRSSPAGANSVIVLHGDHGSRITDIEVRVENADRFSDEDVIATYSTLFAVRAPGMESGYDARHIPIHTLLAAFLDSGFTSIDADAAAKDRPKINLEDENWNTVGARELPAYWVVP